MGCSIVLLKRLRSQTQVLGMTDKPNVTEEDVRGTPSSLDLSLEISNAVQELVTCSEFGFFYVP